MIKNNKSLWYGQWITSRNAKVEKEPKFSLQEMFGGKGIVEKPVSQRLKPPVIFKKVFKLNKNIKKAIMYITSLGIYQAYLNGKNITDAIFTPDYTEYRKFLQYQTYDVTGLLKKGENIFSIIVADGWYAGRVSVPGGSCQFGDQLALLADLKVENEDNTISCIGTDTSFSVGTGIHRYSDIEIGEEQDLRKLNEIDSSNEFNEKAILYDSDYSILRPQFGPQVKRKLFLSVKDMWYEKNKLVIDFGQVIAGRVRLTAKFPKDQYIKLEHAETLDENGKFFKNIVGRNKDQEDVVIGNGKISTFEPDFTFHGFRYVRITGLKKEDIQSIEAVVIFSDMKRTGHISTSNKTIDRLFKNIKWSQRGNMLSIPTDCPQRERVGWTGDMQVFAATSTFYYDTDKFIRRWLKSVREDQQDNGEILDYSPAPKDFFNSIDFTGTLSSAGWGDAIILVPWVLYQKYGDVDVLKENFSAMKKWHAFAVKSAAGNKKGNARYIWDTKFHYGDWMFPSMMIGNPDPMKSAKVTKDLVATAFLAHTSDILGQIAKILGLKEQNYFEYGKKVRKAFQERFVVNDRLTDDYQGCYVLTLAFEMVSSEIKEKMIKRLVELIEENDNCLDTGFLATPYLLDVLCDNGQIDLAKKLFLQDKCPSWLYEVKNGATTIWESWASIQPNGKVGTLSFNHYAMGCVLDWVIKYVIGLNMTEPGYKGIVIDPKVQILNDFNFSYETQNGVIDFQLKDGEYYLKVPKKIKATICKKDGTKIHVSGCTTEWSV